MSDPNDQNVDDATPPAADPNTPPVVPEDKGDAEPTQEEKLKAMVDAELKAIKEKLDSAYRTRDEALGKLADIEQKAKEEERQRLKDEGKVKEALELELAEKNARLETLEKRNVELTRDIDVNRELGALQFKSERARAMAFGDITAELVQNESGEWVHKSGASITDFISSYAGNEDNSFMFKQKASSGAGLETPSAPGDLSKPKSLFAMKQSDVLKLAEQGKLRK